MNFRDQERPDPVGAQFIGASPIYRPGERIDGLLANKSAVGTVNRVHDKSAPYDGWRNVSKCIKALNLTR